MSDDLSEGIHFQKINDAKLYLDASIHTVLETLFEAILLVILVVWVFLQDLRSTFIPSVSIVVSLIGTFAFIQLMGFSLNLLTLLALVLAIGTVVDDAIIVVEAVQANFDRGYRSPYLVLHRCHAQRGHGTAHLHDRVYGGLHPREHDWRYVGSLLPTVWIDHGGRCGHLGHQCLHALAGTLCPAASHDGAHHAPWHVAADDGYGSRGQWRPFVSLLRGGRHDVGHPRPALPCARLVHHLPVAAGADDAKENGGVIGVNYSK